MVEANYIGNVGRNFGRLVDYNTVRGDLFDGRLDRLNPSFGGINYRAMLTRTEYHGMQLQVNRRFKDGFSGQVSYTLGKAMDNGSDVQVRRHAGGRAHARSRMGGVRLRRASSPGVQLAVGAAVSFRESGGIKGAVLGGWQINGITQLQSGFPFNVNTSAAYPTGDYNGDGVNNDRPNLPSFGLDLPCQRSSGLHQRPVRRRPTSRVRTCSARCRRNAYRGPGLATTDLSFFKDFVGHGHGSKLQFRAEVFNVFNRVNLQRPNGNMAQATFGKSTQAFAAREIQLALKFIF